MIGKVSDVGMFFLLSLILLSCTISFTSPYITDDPVFYIGQEELFSEITTQEKSVDFHFIDVGQGDSTLVQFATGENILIDGGKPEKGKQVLQYLREKGIHQLDWVVATHPDYDHIGGLITVLKNIDVKNVLDSGKEKETETYEMYQQTIQNENIPVTIAKEGETVPIEGATVIVLNAERPSDEPNDSSIVLKIETDQHTALLLGDIPQKIEKELIKKYPGHADVLKVAHHGSHTSTSAELLRQVRPSIAVLTYGKDNDFGHPHAIVTHRLKRYGTPFISTERSGNIQISLTKQGVYVLDTSLVLLCV